MSLTKAKEISSGNPVVVFSKTYCPFCVSIKNLLSKLDASFKAVELDTENDGSEIQAALVEWTGQRTVPNVFIGGKHIGGCDDQSNGYFSSATPVHPSNHSSMAIYRRWPAAFDSVYYPAVALALILVACVDLCNAVTVVDGYQLVQYDLSGVSFESRLATLNHHVGSSFFTSSFAVDLFRTVLMFPIREFDLDLIKEYIG